MGGSDLVETVFEVPWEEANIVCAGVRCMCVQKKEEGKKKRRRIKSIKKKNRDRRSCVPMSGWRVLLGGRMNFEIGWIKSFFVCKRAVRARRLLF